jgi:hypothetical protein
MPETINNSMKAHMMEFLMCNQGAWHFGTSHSAFIKFVIYFVSLLFNLSEHARVSYCYLNSIRLMSTWCPMRFFKSRFFFSELSIATAEFFFIRLNWFIYYSSGVILHFIMIENNYTMFLSYACVIVHACADIISCVYPSDALVAEYNHYI